MMDFALEGVKWWSLVMLDGYSRTILAGAIAPSEATWAALLVLYTACLRYGAPETLISDSGGGLSSPPLPSGRQTIASLTAPHCTPHRRNPKEHPRSHHLHYNA